MRQEASEAELIELARRGDGDAYVALLRPHESVAFRTAYLILGSAEGAEALYLISGDPSGGRVSRVAEDGSLEVVVGTGSLGASDDGMRATEIGVLPSDIAFAPDGALLFSQSEPEPAVRRVDPETCVVTTILR